MPSAIWLLLNNRPRIQIELSQTSGRRNLLADSGAGTKQSAFDLLLRETDCRQSGGLRIGDVKLTGAYPGTFPLYLLHVRIVQLRFGEYVPVAAIPQVPKGFDGIAAFKFLRRFHYGNFADPDSFGLDDLAAP